MQASQQVMPELLGGKGKGNGERKRGKKSRERARRAKRTYREEGRIERRERGSGSGFEMQKRLAAVAGAAIHGAARVVCLQACASTRLLKRAMALSDPSCPFFALLAGRHSDPSSLFPPAAR